MVENFITNDRIIQGEPALDDYLRSGQIGWDDIITEAYDEYLCDMKDRKIDLRRLGIRLVLPADETASAEDLAERRRIVVTTDGSYVFVLKGCNTSDGTYSDVKTITITAAGTYDYLIYSVYKFYKLTKTSGSGTYSAYMYETTFDYPLLYLMRSKIYYSLYHRNGDDAFKEKSEYYKAEYLQKVNDKPATHYYYDYDDDGEVDELEMNKATIQTITVRP